MGKSEALSTKLLSVGGEEPVRWRAQERRSAARRKEFRSVDGGVSAPPFVGALLSIADDGARLFTSAASNLPGSAQKKGGM